MMEMPPSQPYTLPSRSRQPHKPKLVKEYGCPTHDGKLKETTQNGKTRKPNKMYSECAFELLSSVSAIRYFSDIGKCERTHHT